MLSQSVSASPSASPYGMRRIVGGTGKLPIRRAIWAMLLLVCVGSLTLMVSLAYYTADLHASHAAAVAASSFPSSAPAATHVTIVVNNEIYHNNDDDSVITRRNNNNNAPSRLTNDIQPSVRVDDTTIPSTPPLSSPSPSPSPPPASVLPATIIEDDTVVDTTEEVEQLFGSERTDITAGDNDQPAPGPDVHDGHRADTNHADITKFLLLGSRVQDTNILDAAFKRHRRVRMTDDAKIDRYDRYRFKVNGGHNRWWIGGHMHDMLADPNAAYRTYQLLHQPQTVKLLVMLRDPTRVFESGISDAIDYGLIQLDASPSPMVDAPLLSNRDLAQLVHGAARLRQQMDMCIDARRRAPEAPVGPTGVEEDDDERDIPTDGTDTPNGDNVGAVGDEVRDEPNEFGERARNPITLRRMPTSSSPTPLPVAGGGGGRRNLLGGSHGGAAHQQSSVRRPIEDLKTATDNALANAAKRKSTSPPQRRRTQNTNIKSNPHNNNNNDKNTNNKDDDGNDYNYEITTENTDDHTGDEDERKRAPRRRPSTPQRASNDPTPPTKAAFVNDDGESYDMVAQRGLDDYCYKQYIIDSSLRRPREAGSLPPTRKQLESLFSVLIERGCYHSQLAHWLYMWPRANLFVFTAEQLLANPETVLRSIMTFLGMPLPLKDHQLLTRRYGLHLTKQEWYDLAQASATAAVRAEETAPIATASSTGVSVITSPNDIIAGVANANANEFDASKLTAPPASSPEWSLLPLSVRRQLVELYRPFNHKLRSLLHIELGFPRLDYSYSPRTSSPSGWLPQASLSKIPSVPHQHRVPPTTPLNHPQFRIAYILPYMGKSWPIWFNYFLMSCSSSAYLMGNSFINNFICLSLLMLIKYSLM
jgi:hypothetical protein